MAAASASPTKTAKAVPLFTQLEDVTVDKVIQLCKGAHFNEERRPRFIFVIGAPGVGKSSQAKKFIGAKVYDSMYNVSLDKIVEHIAPYRNSTRELYDAVKEKRNVTNEDYAKMSNMYLKVITSRKSNFSIANQTARISRRLLYPDAASSPEAAGSPPANKVNTLIEILNEALIAGIQRGYNIIYDTTFDGTLRKAEKVLGYIHQYQPIPYDIEFIHIVADIPTIQQRIRNRHEKMIMNGFLRAVNPLVTDKLSKQNKSSFDKLKEKYPEYTYNEIDNTRSRSRSRSRSSSAANKP